MCHSLCVVSDVTNSFVYLLSPPLCGNIGMGGDMERLHYKRDEMF